MRPKTWHNFFLQKLCAPFLYGNLNPKHRNVMKNPKSIWPLIGIAQDDLALLLNVNRRRLSQFGLGSKLIPVAAIELVTEIFEYLKVAALPAAMQDQQLKKQQAVESILAETNLQLELTARRIAKMKQMYNQQIKALQVVDFLHSRDNGKDESIAAILRTVVHKATQSLKSHGLDSLFRLEHKLEMLQLEKLLLEAQLRKMTATPENTSGE